MGTIVPTLGNSLEFNASGIGSALFSGVQQRVLGLLFGQPERSFQGAELIRLARGGTGAAHRQLLRLERAGLVRVTRIGNQKHYQANVDSPVFSELRGLIQKTVGLLEPLRMSLAPVSGQILAAFVFGSVARASESATSDIDLLVISDSLGYTDVIEHIRPAEETLAREISVILMMPADWATRSAAEGSFADRVQKSRKLFVVGTERDLEPA